MDYPNDFRAIEERMRKAHSDWFVDEPLEEEKAPDLVGERLEEIKDGIRQLATSLTQVLERIGTNKGWWVAAALFVYILLQGARCCARSCTCIHVVELSCGTR